jgi:hypothetical protein
MAAGRATHGRDKSGGRRWSGQGDWGGGVKSHLTPLGPEPIARLANHWREGILALVKVIRVEVTGGSAATDAELAALEAELGEPIPAEYRAFLRVSSGATIENCVSRHGAEVELGDLRCHAVAEAIAARRDIAGIPKRQIPIACDSCGNEIVLALDGGAIGFWDHELEDPPTPLAPSLDEFLAGLERAERPPNLKAGQLISAWIDPEFLASLPEEGKRRGEARPASADQLAECATKSPPRPSSERRGYAARRTDQMLDCRDGASLADWFYLECAAPIHYRLVRALSSWRLARDLLFGPACHHTVNKWRADPRAIRCARIVEPLLESPDERLVVGAMHALATLDPSRAAAPVRRMSSHSSPRVSGAAKRLLAWLDAPAISARES